MDDPYAGNKYDRSSKLKNDECIAHKIPLFAVAEIPFQDQGGYGITDE